MNYDAILNFWFEELKPEDWFRKSRALDNLIKERFSTVLEKAAQGELTEWRDTPEGRLAEIIVLDQFSRNIFRGKKEAFGNDALALKLAEEMVFFKQDQHLTPEQKIFAYMPYMHSEDLKHHEEAMELYSLPELRENLVFEQKHKEIIEKFGRFPHRNEMLNRKSTPAEQAFIKTHPGF